MTLFTGLSTDGITVGMYMLQDADNVFAWIFFVVFMIVCSTIGLNLVLAIIINRFSAEKDRLKEGDIERIRIIR